MPLSWNEIRDRSLAFSREWADESSEDAEAKSFWDGFFNVFGINWYVKAAEYMAGDIVGANCVRPPFVGNDSSGGDSNKDVCHTPLQKTQTAIETPAQTVLDTRAQYPSATLADLYDPLTMPPDLVKAHQALDKAVDAAYGKTGFKTEAERVAFLFERYQQLTAPLVTTQKSEKKKKRGV